MAKGSIVSITTAESGAGKSYRRCAWYLAQEWLPKHKGKHYSNFPVKFDAWTDEGGVERGGFVAYMKKKGMEDEEVRERVQIIPKEEMDRWRNIGLQRGQEPAGPW